MRRLPVTSVICVLSATFALSPAPVMSLAAEEKATASPTLPDTCGAPALLERVQLGLDELLTNLPHDAPDLEAMLPREVAGRRLLTWSMAGIDAMRGLPEYSSLLPPLTEAERAAFEETAASLGLVVDDWAMAVGGRSDVEGDPPYFVNAYRIRSMPAVMLGPGIGVDRPDAGAWSQVALGGRTVLVGTEAMFDQTEHMRGRPYVYDVGDVRFVVVTDDEAWAAEALTRLCPDPLAERARFLGGRIEEPAWGFAVTFPSDWIVAEVSQASREWMDRRADPQRLSDTILLAQRSGEYECALMDKTRVAETWPATLDLSDVVDDESYWAERDPTVTWFDAAYLGLAAGRTAVIDRLYRDGTQNRDYLFRDRSSWFMLSCSSFDPPDDRWLSIAETLEFLPAQE